MPDELTKKPTLTNNVKLECSDSYKLIGTTPQIFASAIFNNRFYSRRLNVLLDTGAAFSCLSQSMFDRIRNEIGLQCLEKRRPNPQSANMHTLKTIAETNFDLQFSNATTDLLLKNVRFSVFSKLNFDVILGIEVINILNMRVSPKGNAVKLHNEWFQLEGDVDRVDLDVIKNYSIKFGPYLYANYCQIGLANMTESHGLSSSPTLNYITARRSGKFSNDLDMLIRFSPAELQGKTKTIMFISSIEISCPNEISNKANLDFIRAESLLSGNWNLTNITSPVTTKDRILINENFTDTCLSGSCLSSSGKNNLKSILLKFRHVFSSNDTDIGLYTDEEFSVDLKDSKILPPYIKPRTVPFAAEEFVKTKLEELVAKGIFEPSPKGSATNSPVHIVTTTKNGERKFRLTVDYSVLNGYIQPNTFPIPRIRDVLDKLSGSKYFSNIDARSGFWNLKLDKKSRDLLSFSVNSRQYRPIRLPMGLKTSPGLFQRVMMNVVNEYLDKFCLVYLDDLLIFSKTEEDHLKHINLILKRFEKSGILLNHTKCVFGMTCLKYLGFHVSSEGWKPLPDRVESIKNFPVPTNQKSVKRFIGCCSFLSYCIPGLQYNLQPLHDISGKKSKFEWGKDQDECFNRIKNLICNSVLMAYPDSDPRRTLFLTTDASDKGFGSVLSQLDYNGIECPLGFHSGQFKNCQKNWEIRVKEFYSFYVALDFFHDYLLGRNFVWRTDNQCLRFYQTNLTNRSARKNMKIVRWIEYINQFSFSIELHKGTSGPLTVPDALSRIYSINKDFKVSDLSSIKIENFWVKSCCTLSEFIDEQKKDSDLENTKTSKYWVRERNKIKFFEENGLLKCERKEDSKKLVIVPKTLENKIIEYYHFPHHLSVNKVKDEILENYYFPSILRKVRAYIKECPNCVKQNPDRSFKLTNTKTSTPNHPMQLVQCDLMGPLPMTIRGNRYIFALVDQFTRFAILRPIPNKEGKTIVAVFDEIISLYGPMLSVQCDNGTEFRNKDVHSFLEKLKISFKHSTPYRPTSNGMVERTNQEILRYLKLFESNDSNWDENLNCVNFCINNTINRHLGRTPFELFHGWRILFPSFLMQPKTQILSSEDLRNFNYEHSQRINKHRKVLRNLYEDELNRKNELITDNSDLKVGQRVYLKIERPKGTSKLFQTWQGLYQVKRVLDKHSYLVTHVDDPRREFIAFRPRLKVFGPEPTSEDKTIVEGKKNGKAEIIEKIVSSSSEKSPYNLRNKNDIDYRKYY